MHLQTEKKREPSSRAGARPELSGLAPAGPDSLGLSHRPLSISILGLPYRILNMNQSRTGRLRAYMGVSENKGVPYFGGSF